MLLLIYMRAKLGLILILPALLFAFQNCGKAASPMNSETVGSGGSNSQTVIGSTAGLTKITYDPLLGEASANPASSFSSGVHLELDLSSGNLTLEMLGTVHSCSLADDPRLQIARAILAGSSVCEPGPLPPNTAVCEAYGIPDIELSNASDSVQLRPVICSSGVFLCDGNDQKLRDLLLDLRTNVPDGCK